MTSQEVLAYSLLVAGASVVAITLRVNRRVGPSHNMLGLARVCVSWTLIAGGALVALSGLAMLIPPI